MAAVGALRVLDLEAAAAANADHANALTVHERQAAQIVDAGAEVLDKGFR